jgi:hypothetical protein
MPSFAGHRKCRFGNLSAPGPGLPGCLTSKLLLSNRAGGLGSRRAFHTLEISSSGKRQKHNSR